MTEWGEALGGGVVRLANGDEVFTYEYDTVRLPEDLGGAWVCVLEREVVHLPDGRIGVLNHLAHPSVNVIEVRGEGAFLWVKKPNDEEE